MVGSPRSARGRSRCPRCGGRRWRRCCSRSALPPQLAGAPAWVWWALYLACYVTGGWEPALAGLRALRDKTLDVDLLMIVAAIGAAAIGQVFDGGAADRHLRHLRCAGGVRDPAHRGLGARPARPGPRTGHPPDRDGAEDIVDAADLQVGDVVLVRPGERIGADGRSLDGASEVDQASITGEPLPVLKQPATRCSPAP